MKCPKCGAEQTGTEKCDSCGVIFEKYRRYLEAREERERIRSTQTEEKAPGLSVNLIVAVLLCLGGVAGGYFWFKSSKPIAVPVQIVSTAAPNKGENAEKSPAGERVSFSGVDLAAQLKEKSPPGNLIEEARNATVFIQTQWGLGSGFFVDDACTIVTNKHVVKLSDENLATAEGEIKKWRSAVTSIRDKIKYNQEVIQRVKRGEAYSNVPVETIDTRIKEDEEKVAKLEKLIQETEVKLNDFKSSSALVVILADGTEIDGTVAQISDNNDLAVVRLYKNARCPVIPLGKPENLHQGDKLYTVGSPMGIKHIVTSGIFSGRTEIEGRAMLQTDAPINPGNSGGPLIDQSGQVVGINTMVLRNAQGIGFSIPITDALKDLNLAKM